MSIRWGFIGASWVAATAMAPAVNSVKAASLYAVASRDAARAAALNPVKVHTSYADLLADENVDAVYISLANHMHLNWTIAALEAGKHVLCEKPIALNQTELKQMAAAATAADKLLVEAIWTRWHPRFARMVEIAARGDVGEITQIDSAFTFPADFKASNYRLTPEFGGGALLDLGPYQFHTWSALTQNAALSVVSVDQNIGQTGIDLTTTVQAELGGKIKTTSISSFEQPEQQQLVITGTAGTIEFPTGEAFTNWNEPSSIRIGEITETFAPVDPFALMIDALGLRILGESAWLPELADSLFVAAAMDQISASNPRC